MTTRSWSGGFLMLLLPIAGCSSRPDAVVILEQGVPAGGGRVDYLRLTGPRDVYSARSCGFIRLTKSQDAAQNEFVLACLLGFIHDHRCGCVVIDHPTGPDVEFLFRSGEECVCCFQGMADDDQVRALGGNLAIFVKNVKPNEPPAGGDRP